jgi:2-keto-4-pentenoate hydratase/2-oxohepta-3-ene-1,7-dioic acid hydratase in catechol pathway
MRADALAGPFEDISIPKYVRDLDYEGELCFVIGRDCKDLDPSHEPSDYILGFMVGNDVSAREWQTQETAGGQHHVAKSFDKFALMGPFLTSYSALRNPENLKLETRVNNEVRQQGHTSDLLFSIKDIMVHLSRGKTLRRGTVVMTGTPSGVAAFMDPKAWIKNGDLVEITIEGLGTLRNKHVFV